MSTRLASRITGSDGRGSTSSGGASALDGPSGAAGGSASAVAVAVAGSVAATGDSARATCAAESSAAMKSRAVSSAMVIDSSPVTSKRSPENEPPTRRIMEISEPTIEPRACASTALESSGGRGAIARTLSIQCCSRAASISCARANASRKPRPTNSSTTFALVPRTHRM